jgi:hypothetical protein
MVAALILSIIHKFVDRMSCERGARTEYEVRSTTSVDHRVVHFELKRTVFVSGVGASRPVCPGWRNRTACAVPLKLMARGRRRWIRVMRTVNENENGWFLLAESAQAARCVRTRETGRLAPYR